MAKAQRAESQSEEPTTEVAQEPSTRPAARFTGSGGLNVAVWKHKTEQGYDRYSVRIDRSYKDGEGYQTTQYLRDGDLLRVQKLLDQADNWIEQDKAKHRSGGVSQDQGQSRF